MKEIAELTKIYSLRGLEKEKNNKTTDVDFFIKSYLTQTNDPLFIV